MINKLTVIVLGIFVSTTALASPTITRCKSNSGSVDLGLVRVGDQVSLRDTKLDILETNTYLEDEDPVANTFINEDLHRYVASAASMVMTTTWKSELHILFYQVLPFLEGTNEVTAIIELDKVGQITGAKVVGPMFRAELICE